MKAVLDTNVLVSGVFFGGVPGRVLEAWAAGRFELVLSPGIFDEYLRTFDRLSKKYPVLEARGVLETIIGRGTLIRDPEETPAVSKDPDDDKFLYCAREADAVVVSGDQHLLDVFGWNGVTVLTPKSFLSTIRP